MAKPMRLRLINDFLRNGEIGGVRPGTVFGDIERLLGTPKLVAPIAIGTNVHYGDIRILSSESEGGVWFIEIERRPQQGKDKFVGNKSVQIVSEGLIPDISIAQTVRLLAEHGLAAELREPTQGTMPEGDYAERCYLQVASGAEITFERFGIDNPGPEFRLLKLDINKYYAVHRVPRVTA